MILHFPFRVAVCLIFMLASCAEKKDAPAASDPIPADSLIPREKMILLLTDVHMVEAALLLERNEGLVSKDKTGFYYDGIFAKYNISRSRYDANMKHYSQNPMEMAKMYEKVIREIQNKQKRYPTKK
jgi:hypothetical protein